MGGPDTETIGRLFILALMHFNFNAFGLLCADDGIGEDVEECCRTKALDGLVKVFVAGDVVLAAAMSDGIEPILLQCRLNLGKRSLMKPFWLNSK
ncbi:hypothetical protein EVAR_70400_1 [Eumeta japonica]|uniref:Uncharacterized protein n=1 Tax=Eumeta variegata TaxID=151549 RepID=A0A4C2ABX1_EUMVA|nr:hypothetical protein EVAR_70400_1 [Eumeta japonica]